MEPIQQGPLQRRRWRLGTARRTEEDVPGNHCPRWWATRSLLTAIPIVQVSTSAANLQSSYQHRARPLRCRHRQSHDSSNAPRFGGAFLLPRLMTGNNNTQSEEKVSTRRMTCSVGDNLTCYRINRSAEEIRGVLLHPFCAAWFDRTAPALPANTLTVASVSSPALTT
jgi:hypothetical protein